MIEGSPCPAPLQQVGLCLENLIGTLLAVRALVGSDEWHNERGNLVGEDALERNRLVADSESRDNVKGVVQAEHQQPGRRRIKGNILDH